MSTETWLARGRPGLQLLRMRQWVLTLHLYAGLLCAPYLVIFGLSSLQFNHRSGPVSASGPVDRWEQTVPAPGTTDNLQTAQAVRDSLGMIGWTPWWKMRRDDSGNLHFTVDQPGRSSKIQFVAADNRAIVESQGKGILNVLRVLHGMMRVPNSGFATVWGLYTDLCTWTVVFAAVSGIYLWIQSRRETRAGWWVLLSGIGASVALMVYIVVRG